MTIAGIMTKKVLTITEDASVAALRPYFVEAKIQHVPVIDVTHRLIGIVSVKDYYRTLSGVADAASDKTTELFMQSRKVKHIMSTPVVSVKQDHGILAAAALLLEKNISCLPVIDDQQRLIGIVSWKDILRLIVRAQHKKQRKAEEEE